MYLILTQSSLPGATTGYQGSSAAVFGDSVTNPGNRCFGGWKNRDFNSISSAILEQDTVLFNRRTKETAAQALVWTAKSSYGTGRAGRCAERLKHYNGTLLRGQFLCGPCWQFRETSVRGEVHLHRESYRSLHLYPIKANVL